MRVQSRACLSVGLSIYESTHADFDGERVREKTFFLSLCKARYMTYACVLFRRRVPCLDQLDAFPSLRCGLSRRAPRGSIIGPGRAERAEELHVQREDSTERERTRERPGFLVLVTWRRQYACAVPSFLPSFFCLSSFLFSFPIFVFSLSVVCLCWFLLSAGADVQQEAGKAAPREKERIFCRHLYEDRKRCFLVPSKVEPLLRAYLLKGKKVSEPLSLEVSLTYKNACRQTWGSISVCASLSFFVCLFFPLWGSARSPFLLRFLLRSPQTLPTCSLVSVDVATKWVSDW